MPGGADGFRTDLALLRYTADGVPDLSFGDDGRVVGDPCGHSDSSVAGLEIQTGGKIVASGECGGLAVFRFNPDGSPDTSFNKTGAAVIGALQTSGRSSDVGVQNNGKIVVSGQAFVNGSYDFILARYDQNGSLDRSFNGSGIVTRSTGTGNDQATSLAIRPDGKLIAAGYGTNGGMDEFIILRLNTDGTVDASWGNSGAVSIGFDGNSYANAAAIDSMGRVLIGGSAGGLFGVARLKSDTSAVSFASVSGRVLDANGQAVSRATVSMTDSAGVVRTALANPFGYYRFDGVRTGETYTFMVMAKRFRFSPRVVTIGGDLTDLNLTAN